MKFITEKCLHPLKVEWLGIGKFSNVFRSNYVHAKPHNNPDMKQKLEGFGSQTMVSSFSNKSFHMFSIYSSLFLSFPL